MLIAITLLGAIVRVLLFLSGRSLWFDETASIAFSNVPVSQVVLLNLQDTHPPLYYLALHFAIRFFGLNEWAIRLPSLAAGILAIPCVWLLVRELFGRRTATLTAFWMVFSAFFINLSFEIRNHGMPILFVTLAAYAWLRHRRTGEGRFGRIYALAVACGLYTSHLVWFWFAGTAAADAWDAIRKRRIRNLGHTLAAFALAAPTWLVFCRHSLGNHEIFAYEGLDWFTALTILKKMLAIYWYWFASAKYFIDWNKLIVRYATHSPMFWIAVGFFVSVMYIGVTRWWSLRKENPLLARLYFWWIAAPVILIGIVNPTRLESRYFGIFSIFAFALVADGFLKLRSVKFRALVAGLGLLTLGGALVFVLTSKTDTLHREDYQQMVHYVCEHSTAKDAVITNGNPAFDLYRKWRGWRTQADVLGSLADIPRDGGRYERIWFTDGIPMEANDFWILWGRMTKLGFVPHTPEYRFGWEVDYVAVDLFVRSGHRPSNHSSKTEATSR